MKSAILFPVSLLFGILMLFNIPVGDDNNRRPVNTSLNIVECPPSSSVLLTAKSFKSKYGNEPMRVRRNVDSLTQAEINAIKVGILKMRALPYTNPTSYLYQSAIHGTLLTDNLPSWNMCHRPGEGVFFFAWHRMYVYFFERILRAKSGRANLTLPYWNYQLNPSLHPAWRDNSLGNPLYDNTRSIAINSGGALPASISTSIVNALNLIPYYTFQSNFNSGPHGSVHISVGGAMAVVNTAVKDPVFWLHHSNVDRLWEEWRSMCGGRANPTDATWMNKTYTFFDENGDAVNMMGSEVVEIASQLSYRYDDREPVISCPAPRVRLAASVPLLSKQSSVVISGQTHRADFVNESPALIESYIRRNNRRTFNFGNTTNPERLNMLLDRVNVETMPQGVVEVYLNLPAGTAPVAESNYFVGLLDLFSAQHQAAHHTAAEQAEEPLVLDVTKAAQAQGLTLPGLRNSAVTFVVRGLIVNGREIATTAHITIRNIRFAVDTYQQE